MPNSVKIGQTVADISRFLWFLNGDRRHLWFSKIRTFNGLSLAQGQCASPCQILSKSVKRLRRYGNSTVFQNGGRPPSWNSWVCTWTTHDEHLVVLLLCQIFGWNRCCRPIFDNNYALYAASNILKMPIHAHKIWVLGIWFPKMGRGNNEPPKRTPLRVSTSYEV